MAVADNQSLISYLRFAKLDRDSRSPSRCHLHLAMDKP